MFEAARLHDGIEHTSALAGFLLGAVCGIALVAIVAFTVCTAGLGGFLIGMAAGLVGSGMVMAGE
jgi:hypothetical protein